MSARHIPKGEPVHAAEPVHARIEPVFEPEIELAPTAEDEATSHFSWLGPQADWEAGRDEPPVTDRWPGLRPTPG